MKIDCRKNRLLPAALVVLGLAALPIQQAIGYGGNLLVVPQLTEGGEAGFVAECRLNASPRLGFRTDDLMDGGRGWNRVEACRRVKC
ncbi:MAG: hypothetical protein OXN81_10405 [Alphaproteobacteria bacterium]|nr:hypothetical protein [Alphaproteobacteria bacterium]